MIRNISFCVLLLLGLLIGSGLSRLGFAAPGTGDSAAQTENSWARPLELFSTSGRASEAEVVVDGAGTVHMFWAYGEPENQAAGTSQSIYYAFEREGKWSEPVDILVSPGGRVARYPSIAVDQGNYLHIAWSGSDTIFYSRAYAPEAGRSRGWMPPVALISGVSVRDPAVATKGDTTFAIWTQTDAGLMLSKSNDGGRQWSVPKAVFPTAGNQELARWGRLAIDNAGRLHVVLTHTLREETDTLLENGDDPNFLYYLRSEDGGQSWSTPFRLADEPNFGQANIVTYGNNSVHIVWNGRAGRHGRYHRYSDDAGYTWSNILEVLQPAPASPIGTGGLTGFPALAVDNTGVLHMVSATGGGDYYFYWENGRWSLPHLVSPGLDGRGLTGEQRSLEYPSISVGMGNQLHVAFHDGFERIWYVTAKLNLPATRPQPYATVTPVFEQNEAVFQEAESDPHATPLPLDLSETDRPENNSWPEILLLAGPGALLVMIVTLFQLRQKYIR